MADPKWMNDQFLDELRGQTDLTADTAVASFLEEHSLRKINYIFQHMQSDDCPLLDDTPAAFREFIAATGELPHDLDPERLHRGSQVFLRHACSSALILLAASLPAGYAAPCLTDILMISRDLQRDPYRRLMGVVQMLVNISSPGAFVPGGLAVVTAQKLRLLHAGVRALVPRHRPGYSERFGPPVNHEDMLATLMGFSYLVIDGLRRLKLGLIPEEEEDFYYLWRVYALLMGIHPPGSPLDTSLIPQSLEDAAAFYTSYERRHYAGPADNPGGVTLAQDNLEMIERLIPQSLHHLNLTLAPRIAMAELLGHEGMARVGLEAVPGHEIVKEAISAALAAEQLLAGAAPCSFVERLSRHLMQTMVDVSRGGIVNFVVPGSVSALRSQSLA